MEQSFEPEELSFVGLAFEPGIKTALYSEDESAQISIIVSASVFNFASSSAFCVVAS